jgi:hypothetical protein
MILVSHQFGAIVAGNEKARDTFLWLNSPDKNA